MPRNTIERHSHAKNWQDWFADTSEALNLKHFGYWEGQEGTSVLFHFCKGRDGRVEKGIFNIVEIRDIVPKFAGLS